MAVTLMLPGSLKAWLNGSTEAHCQGATIAECIAHLDAGYPGFRERVLDANGEFAQTVLIFKNGENIKNQDGLATPVHDGDIMGIIPLGAGG